MDPSSKPIQSPNPPEVALTDSGVQRKSIQKRSHKKKAAVSLAILIALLVIYKSIYGEDPQSKSILRDLVSLIIGSI
jgi:hypothetical protein